MWMCPCQPTEDDDVERLEYRIIRTETTLVNDDCKWGKGGEGKIKLKFLSIIFVNKMYDYCVTSNPGRQAGKRNERLERDMELY